MANASPPNAAGSSAASGLPAPSPEHRRVAAGMFERANQVVATGNYDYGIRLLLDCCKLDPANLLYRQALRRTQKAKYRNNLRGSWLAWLFSWPARARLKAARQKGDHQIVLELGERILVRNPWDVPAQMDMAASAEALGLVNLALWSLEQARQKQPRDVALNRALARLYERAGHFTQAMGLWALIRKSDPTDNEAQQKLKDLAASDTIARGNFTEALTGTSGSATHAAAGPGKAAASSLSKSTPVPGRASSPADREAASLRSRLEADPTSAELYLQLARLYRRANDLEQAHAILTQGLGASGNAFELAMELADLETEPFRRNLAITEQKLKEAPDDAPLRKIRLHLRKEVNTRELEIYRRKADRYPMDLVHRYEVGVRLMRAGQLDEAIKELQSARGEPRIRCQALLALGYCFKARSNWKLAQRNFEEVLEQLSPSDLAHRKEVLFELAQGHAESGDLTRALELAHELANLDFSYRGIGQLLDEWQARLQKAS